MARSAALLSIAMRLYFFAGRLSLCAVRASCAMKPELHRIGAGQRPAAVVDGLIIDLPLVIELTAAMAQVSAATNDYPERPARDRGA